MAKKKKTAHVRGGDSPRARAAHKRWLRHQIKVATRTLRKKTAADAEHRAALTRLRSLESELAHAE